MALHAQAYQPRTLHFEVENTREIQASQSKDTMIKIRGGELFGPQMTQLDVRGVCCVTLLLLLRCEVLRLGTPVGVTHVVNSSSGNVL